MARILTAPPKSCTCKTNYVPVLLESLCLISLGGDGWAGAWCSYEAAGKEGIRASKLPKHTHTHTLFSGHRMSEFRANSQQEGCLKQRRGTGENINPGQGSLYKYHTAALSRNGFQAVSQALKGEDCRWFSHYGRGLPVRFPSFSRPDEKRLSCSAYIP